MHQDLAAIGLSVAYCAVLLLGWRGLAWLIGYAITCDTFARISLYALAAMGSLIISLQTFGSIATSDIFVRPKTTPYEVRLIRIFQIMVLVSWLVGVAMNISWAVYWTYHR